MSCTDVEQGSRLVDYVSLLGKDTVCCILGAARAYALPKTVWHYMNGTPDSILAYCISLCSDTNGALSQQARDELRKLLFAKAQNERELEQKAGDIEALCSLVEYCFSWNEPSALSSAQIYALDAPLFNEEADACGLDSCIDAWASYVPIEDIMA